MNNDQGAEWVQDKARIDGLRQLAGYVEDGSCETVSISQDDATRDWVVCVGRTILGYAKTFRGAIDQALQQDSRK